MPAAPTSQIPDPNKPQPFSPFPSRIHWTVALNNQLVVDPAYDGGVGYFPIDGDRVIAYDLKSGGQQWIAMATPRSAPAVGEGLLFVEVKGAITALHTSDGSIAWSTPIADTLAAPLTWAGGWLIGVTPSALLAWRAADGSLLWRRDLAGAHGSPAIAANYVYVPLADGRVMAFHIADGAPRWERRLPGPANEILALDDRLFVGSNDNFLYCLKTVDGAIDWKSRTGADVVNRPTIDEDRIYFVSLDNILRVVNRNHGVQQWKKALPFRPLRSPLIVADTVIVSGVAGAPQAFVKKDGKAAGELTIGDAEIAAPLHTFQGGGTLGPTVIAVTRTIEAGATLLAVSHVIDPPVLPFTVLPGIIPVAMPKLQ